MTKKNYDDNYDKKAENEEKANTSKKTNALEELSKDIELEDDYEVRAEETNTDNKDDKVVGKVEDVNEAKKKLKKQTKSKNEAENESNNITLKIEDNEYYDSVEFINKLLTIQKPDYAKTTESKENLGVTGSPFLVGFFKHFKNIQCRKIKNKKGISYAELMYGFIVDSLLDNKVLDEIVEKTGDEVLEVLLDKLKKDTN